MDLNSIYFIEFKGRFQMDIGSNFEWTWVIGQGIFSQIFCSLLQGFEDKTKAKMTYKMMKRLLME
jgi:hypothetical protein